MSSHIGHLLRSVAFIAAGIVLSACQERVVSYNSFLTGLQGSEQRLPSNRKLGDYKDPTLVREDMLVKEDKDKRKTLVAKCGRHLMIHIYNCIDEGNADLFLDQVLSKQSKAELVTRGQEPKAAFTYLAEHQADLQQLFSQMPAGENTPGLFMKPQGGGVQRVQLDGLAAKGLFWNGFDMVQERGNWRLVWMVGPERYDD
jgi:hypothetical protein